VPVVMIGDIDRGGVIASLVGTKVVLAQEDAALVRGFLINKFRGDPTLFSSGLARIAQATGWEPLGLVPYFPDARLLPAEDALGLDRALNPIAFAGAPSGRRVHIVVVVLPHIANFDDLDPLEAEPGVELVQMRPGAVIPGDADLIILPGSKATIADLAALRQAGFDIDIAAHVRRGGAVLGICGGYQMLGRTVADPAGIEGMAGTIAGLGLLEVDTVLSNEKRLTPVRGESAGVPFFGYEMHIGATSGPGCIRPFAWLADGTTDGAVSADGRVAGTYVHGLFAGDAQRAAFLARFGARVSGLAYEARIESVLEGLAAHIAAHIDLDRLLSLSA